MNEGLNSVLSDDDIDLLLNMLWDDYDEEDEMANKHAEEILKKACDEKDKEELFEKYYRKGWNDAIEHIQDFLSRVK